MRTVLAAIILTAAIAAPAQARYLHIADARGVTDQLVRPEVAAGDIDSYEIPGCRHTALKRLVTCDLTTHHAGDESGLDDFAWYIDVRQGRSGQLHACWRYVVVADGGCTDRQDDQADAADPGSADDWSWT